MNALSFQALNCNSLVRYDANCSFSSPYVGLLKSVSDICFLSDVRMSEKKLSFLADKLSLTSQIGIKRQRLYATQSENNKTGGVAIYLPQCFDEILKTIYVSKDESLIPRYISLISEVVGGPKVMLTAFYGCPGTVGEKAKVMRRLYKHLYDLTCRFGASILIVGGDFNVQLNMLNEKGCDKQTLKKIIDDFSLLDAFTVCPPDLNKRDINRLSKQNQAATKSDLGNTYFPKIQGHKASRIDGIFFSASLERNMLDKSCCLSICHPSSDHKAVHLYFSWFFAGIPEGNEKPPFFFHNHLLKDKTFVRKMKKEVADAILTQYHKMGGILKEDSTNKIQLNCLESLIFDRAKNGPTNFSALDLLYDIFLRIEKTQNIFLKMRTDNEKLKEMKLIEKIAKLENIKNPSRSDQRLLIAANRDISDEQKRKVRRQALDLAIDFEVLGESGSKYFLRSKIARRSKAFVRIFEKSDGVVCYESFEIEKQFYEHFKNILEAPDPFCKQSFYEFVNPFIDKFGKITDEDRASFQVPISMQEVKYAVSRVKSDVAPGPDGVTGSLIKFLHEICPRLFCKVINDQILTGCCKGKDIMLRKLIFIPKPTQKITIKRFRPISLLNVLFKLGDSCVVNRLVIGLQNAKILPSFMSAYRAGFSTIDSILSLQTFIDNANHTNRKLVIVNWDVSQAFDRCSRQMVQEVLKILGFGDLLINSFAKLPTGALARICINLAETRFPNIFAANGCAQGQKSSSYLFSLAMLVILLRLDMQDVASYKIELGVLKKIPMEESYIEYLWMKDNNDMSQINNDFKKMARNKWKSLSKQEKANLKVEIKQKIFHQETIKRLSDIASIISYSDDGHLFLEYKEIQNILDIMNIFNQFGIFSGLKINSDKTRIVTLNFTLSNEEVECLVNSGFDPDMIQDGNKTFRFLGCDIHPYLLKDGALSRLDQLCDEIEKIAEAFDNNTTLKGRRVVCQTLMVSKLQAALTGFDMKETDMLRIQKIIDKFCHKKKISAGNKKYLSFTRGGIQIPHYFMKFLVARAGLLKGLFTKIIEKKTLPSWGCVLIEGLQYIGFKSPTLLFKSMGQADIRFIIKNFNELGLYSLAGLFRSCEILNDILEQKRSGKRRKKRDGKNCSSNFPKDLTCLSFKTDSNDQSLNSGSLGYKDKHGRFRDAPDPPSGFRSQSLIGSIYDNLLIKRNQQSLLSIWKSLHSNDNCVPAFEFSARNSKEMSRWILNNATTPIILLNTNNQISPSERIMPIISQSKRSEHIFEALASQAQDFCSKMALLVGPGSPKYQPNIFVSWISACTKQNNGKSLYYQVLDAKFGHIQSTAIKKLIKAGITGRVDNSRIAKGLSRGIMAFNSAKSERATVELSLASMRTSRDIARIMETQPKPCIVCGCFERYVDTGTVSFSAHRGFYRHIFIICSPAAFLIQYLKVLSIKIFGFPLEITLSLVLLNEIPYEQFKRTSSETRKIWFSIFNSYKATIYGLFYMRPKELNADFILKKFNQNISVARRIAQSRGSQLLNNICLPKESFGKFISFSRIHERTMFETREFRKEDNLSRRTTFLEENTNNGNQLNANIPRKKKTKNAKPFSAQKRQILITAAFQNIPNKRFTRNGNLELANNV